MKIKNNTSNRIFLLIVTTLLLFCALPALAAPARVAILPFDVHAEKDLTFLQEGILDMLGSRLAWRDKVEVINKNTTKAALASVDGFEGESRALLVGGKLQADYVLFGSLTVFGESVSIDAKMVDVSGQQAPLPFFAQTRGMGEVIPQINQFATTINESVFGRAVAQRPMTAPAPQAGAGQAAPVQPAPQTYDPRMHPEKMLQSGVQYNGSSQENFQGVYAPLAQEIWRGPTIRSRIGSLIVADIDNDGKNEILTLAGDFLNIYRREGERLAPAFEFKIEEINIRCLFVDAIDLDKDGRKEICITGVNETQLGAASLVYRVEDGQLVKILGPENYLFRVVDSAEGPILLGQKTRGDDSRKLHTPVVQLGLGPDGQSLIEVGRTLPFADNVFGIAFGDFMNNGTETVAVLDLKGVISLYSRDGKLLSQGSDQYGGSAAFIEYKGMRYNQADGYKLDRIFLQQRLFAAQFDGDKKTTLLAVRNIDTAKGFLSNTRVFTKSHIDTLVWNELGFAVMERGQSLSGYISDFSIGDTNADGKKEVVFCVVSANKILEDDRSQIFSKQKK